MLFSAGHYTATVYDVITNNWFKIDDRNVSKCTSYPFSSSSTWSLCTTYLLLVLVLFSFIVTFIVPSTSEETPYLLFYTKSIELDAYPVKIGQYEIPRRLLDDMSISFSLLLLLAIFIDYSSHFG